MISLQILLYELTKRIRGYFSYSVIYSFRRNIPKKVYLEKNIFKDFEELTFLSRGEVESQRNVIGQKLICEFSLREFVSKILKSLQTFLKV